MKKLSVAGLIHTINVHGGVRRYFEIGNALIRKGHDYTLYHKVHKEKVPWIDYHGGLAFYSETKEDTPAPKTWWKTPEKEHVFEDKILDIAFTGANECFEDLKKIKAKVKIVFIVAKFYTRALKKLWHEVGNDFLWIGVASGWNAGMEEINGVLCPGGVNTSFFVPAKRKSHKRLRVGFYARKGTDRGIEKIVSVARAMGEAVEFVGYDAYGYDTLADETAGIHVVITRDQNELKQLLQSCDIILSGMGRAGWNNVIAEGMACGAVPVSTPAGVGDLVLPGKTGLICNQESFVGDMITSISWLNDNQHELELMRKKAIKHVQQFSWDIFTDKVLVEAERRL